MKELNVLSIAGRSHWLAHSLCRQGFKVSFFDLTDELGELDPQDQDGPFLLRDKKCDPLFLSFFNDQKDLRRLDDGFSLSSPSGNLSSMSPAYDKSVEKLKIDFENYASKEASFWYDDFLRSFGKARFRLSSAWKQDANVFEPKGDFFIRSSSSADHEEKLSLLEKRGSKIYKVKINQIETILKEIKSNYKNWVVDLTITELKILMGNTVEEQDLYLGWSRKRFKVLNDTPLYSIPKWSVWVSSFYKTWKQENFYILLKSDDQKSLDLWSLEQVYSPDKIEESVEMAKSFLKQKLPMINCEFEKTGDFSSSLNTLFPVSTGYSEINDTKYMWNSPREWLGFNSDQGFAYQSDFSKWLAKNFLNEVRNDITL